jgi:hypothetical protein
VSAGDQFRAALSGVVTGAGAGLACLIGVLANARSLPPWSEFLILSGLGLAGALLAGLCWSTSRGAMMELADVLGLAGISRRLRARVPRRKTT